MLQLGAEPKDNAAWQRFLELRHSVQQDAYQYVRLKDLESSSFMLPKPFLPNVTVTENTLVFVNGRFSSALSKVEKPIVVKSLAEAFPTYGSFLNSRLQKMGKEEKDPFALLNAAFFEDGLFLYIPPNTCVEAPLKIIHLQDQFVSPTLLASRFHLFLGRQVSVKIQMEQTHKQVTLSHFLMDIALEENASCVFESFSHQHESAHDFLSIRATLKQKSLLKCVQATNGGATSRHDYVIKLIGEEAEAALYGAWGLKHNLQHHVHVRMEHSAPSCRSIQKFKGTVDHHSRSSFEGKIFVTQKAQKTEAYQSNNNLILSDLASANSKPNLEIFADDVKASHGATVGQLDEEQLFYLTTRGCTKEMAHSLLVKGFNREVTDLFSDSGLRQRAIEVLV